MTVISLANFKGGSGKTTSAALLASGLINEGYKVAVIDCDRLYPFYSWWTQVIDEDAKFAARAGKTEEIRRHICGLRDRADCIIVDLSGASDVMNAVAFSLSDLVLFPMQGSAMDARGAVHTIELAKLVAENRRSDIKSSVLLTRVNPLVVTNAAKYVMDIMKTTDVPFLEAPIIERSAYRDMFSKKINLMWSEDQKISKLDKARRDIAYFTNAVIKQMAPEKRIAPQRAVA